MNRAEIRWSLACLIAAASAAAPGAGAKAQATPNVTQAGAAGAAGTLQPNGVAPAARDALFAAMDAWHRWAFTDAYEQANRAVMADSTFALARVYRTNIGGGTGSAASIAQYQRAIADAASRPAPEQTLVLAERFTGVNANRLYAAARSAYPNDRRVALEQALALAGQVRIDSLRSLVSQHPDLLGAKLWLSYYLVPGYYTVSSATAYEALMAARNAVRLAPTVPGSHIALANVLHYTGHDDEALMHLGAAAKMDRRNAYAYRLEAEIFLHDGKPQHVERARAALDSAIAVEPTPARRTADQFDRALALLYDGRGSEAMAEAIAAAKADEGLGAINNAATKYSQVAEMAAGIGDSASVEKWIAEAHRVSPGANVGLQEVQALSLSRQPAAARRAFVAGSRDVDTTVAANNSNYHRLLGMILVAEGRPADGIAELKLSDQPSNAFATLSLIDAYRELKDQKNADAALAALVARRDAVITAVSDAIANYRAVKRK
jgi:tetratricopeptide (TPR) repeat protein